MVIKTEEHRLLVKSKDIEGKMIEITLSKKEGKTDISIRHGDSELKTISIEEKEMNEIAEAIYYFM